MTTERDFGRLEGRVEGIEGSVMRIEAGVVELRKEVASLRESRAKAEGGWKVLATTGALAGAVISILINVAKSVWGSHP